MNSYSKYKAYILKLQKKLAFEPFWSVMEKKLFDYINNNNDTSFLKIKSDVQKIFSPEFAEFTDKIFTKYDNIIEKVNELYKNLSEDINRDTEKILAIEEIIKTNIGKYETNEIERISYFTRKAILDDLSSNELKLKLERIGGRVANYSNTIARSQIAGYGRESKNTKAEIGGVLYAEYVGNITENTRTFWGGKPETKPETHAPTNFLVIYDTYDQFYQGEMWISLYFLRHSPKALNSPLHKRPIFLICFI